MGVCSRCHRAYQRHRLYGDQWHPAIRDQVCEPAGASLQCHDIYRRGRGFRQFAHLQWLHRRGQCVQSLAVECRDSSSLQRGHGCGRRAAGHHINAKLGNGISRLDHNLHSLRDRQWTFKLSLVSRDDVANQWRQCFGGLYCVNIQMQLKCAVLRVSRPQAKLRRVSLPE